MAGMGGAGMGAAGRMPGGGVGNPMAGMTGMDPMSMMMEGMMRGGPPGSDGGGGGGNGRPIGPGPPGSADPTAMVSPPPPPYQCLFLLRFPSLRLRWHLFLVLPSQTFLCFPSDLSISPLCQRVRISQHGLACMAFLHLYLYVVFLCSRLNGGRLHERQLMQMMTGMGHGPPGMGGGPPGGRGASTPGRRDRE